MSKQTLTINSRKSARLAYETMQISRIDLDFAGVLWTLSAEKEKDGQNLSALSGRKLNARLKEYLILRELPHAGGRSCKRTLSDSRAVVLVIDARAVFVDTAEVK